MRAARFVGLGPLVKVVLVSVVVALLVGTPLVSGRPVDAREYSIKDLGTLPGGDFSAAYGINDRGQVVSRSNTGSSGPHAFLWEDGEMTDLGTLPGGVYSGASGINDRAQVVGRSYTASGETHAVLWGKRGP